MCNYNHLFSALPLFLVFVLCSTTAVAQDNALTGGDLEPLFPETLAFTTLQEVEPAPEGEGLVAYGLYTDENTDTEFRMGIYLGKSVDQVAALDEMRIMRPAQADDWRAENWSIQGHTVSYTHMDGSSGAFALIDQFMIAMLARNFGDADAMRALIEDIDFSQLEEWESPGEYAPHSMSPDICLTVDCFADRVAACDAGQVGVDFDGVEAKGFFTVQEPTGDGSCLLSFVYSAHPHELMVDQKVLFPVDTEADVFGNFMESVLMPMMNCISGESDSDHCGGPLLEQRPE